ncbi:hypothetical protein B8W72_26120 [Pseudomonas putida]|uniref:Uncharacterized protein n=2 Tax=Pseudomonas putida TaxID=303 RepID=A0A1Y3KFM5_PSEPU|nr:hypothetical protein [Pseudomonas putida]OUM24648.1 hypothetical protein B8W72_26120 [Pseudomonas putida]
MSPELTEEEMRQALFGASTASPEILSQERPSAALRPKSTPKNARTGKSFTPRLRVVLLVGNEFEGKMDEMVHEADTLSTLLAEQEAIRAARKKFRYVQLVSVKAM